MTTFKGWAREASKKPAPTTEVSAIYRGTKGEQIAIWEGAMVERRDKKTGMLAEVERWVWLPRSQIGVESGEPLDDLVEGRTYTFVVPVWLAKDRGLI